MNEREASIVLKLFKEYTVKYNARSLSKAVGLSAMGALKLLERLRQRGLLVVENIGRAKIYRLDGSNPYALHVVAFLLRQEAEESPARVKRWIVELRKLEGSSKIGVLFGSALTDAQHGDVDLLAVLEQPRLAGFNKRVAALNELSAKSIHPVKQSPQDLEANLARHDEVVVAAVQRGVVAFGYEEYVEALSRVAR